MNELHKPESVMNDTMGRVNLSRISVPGGWIYVNATINVYVPDPSAPHVENDAETRIRKARKVYADTIERSNDGHPVNFDTIAGIMDMILAGGEP